MRRTASLAVPALVALLAANCGQGGGGGGGAAAADAARCAPTLPMLTADAAPPITTMPSMPGQAPLPIVRYTFAGPAPELPLDAAAYCFDPSGAQRREVALREALDVGRDDQLTVSIEDDRSWQFFRAGPTPPFGTTIPGAPPTAPTVADVTEARARELAEDVLADIGIDPTGGRLEVRLEVGRWWARFVPDIGGEALATGLEIGPGGVILSGSGHLAEAIEAGRYPLVDAATALARANAPLDEFAASVGRERVDVPLERAVVVPSLRPTEGGTYLVPTVRFEGASGSTGSTPVLAVSDEFLRG